MARSIKIIAIGDKMPSWVKTAFQEYAQRLRAHYNIELIEIAAQKRSHHHHIKKIMQQESAQLLQHCKAQDFVIALDRTGRKIDTQKFADSLANQPSNCINFLIGGPEGIPTDMLNKANQVWSLSDLTFPHPMVRILLIEQIYRAHSILTNHPYHRGN